MSILTIRHSRADEIEQIMPIYESAIKYMRSTGNMEQWTGGYPSAEVILRDIALGNHYVGIDSNGDIAVVFTFIIGEDPTYSHIEGGTWLNSEPYGTIHRIASAGKHSGMLQQCVDYCFTRTNNVRIDTHAHNSPMLNAVSHLGFHKCGTIYIADGSPRTAFHKTKPNI